MFLTNPLSVLLARVFLLPGVLQNGPVLVHSTRYSHNISKKRNTDRTLTFRFVLLRDALKLHMKIWEHLSLTGIAR